MNNLSSYFGLVDAKIRASEKDLPVCTCFLLQPKYSFLVCYNAANLNSHLNLTEAKLIQELGPRILERIGCEK